MFFSFFFVLLVCLETTVRQNNWMRITSVACECVYFSLKVSFRKYLITAMFKVLSQQ